MEKRGDDRTKPELLERHKIVLNLEPSAIILGVDLHKGNSLQCQEVYDSYTEAPNINLQGLPHTNDEKQCSSEVVKSIFASVAFALALPRILYFRFLRTVMFGSDFGYLFGSYRLL